MHVLVNFTPRDTPYGGANSFLRTLGAELGHRGVTLTSDLRADVDVALLNALTDGLTLAHVQGIAERGIPIVHRKTGYRGRGVAELRAEIDGVITGDRLQLELDPYVAHSVFQSEYSRDVFLASGFVGAFTVQPNGIDPEVFNRTVTPRLRAPRRRAFWRTGEPVRVVISTWSTDESKGFPYYRELDRELRGRRDVRVTLVGRSPVDAGFRAIRVVKARGADRLAAYLKRQHVLLQLTSWESCSNALLEGINCGLPAIYLDSGANAEIGGPYGVPWNGSLDEALARLLPRYDELVARIEENPYTIDRVATVYHRILESVAAGKPVAAQ
ncbi:MAG: hypothetical protein U0R50_13965 [Gaiellales bacterium]